MKELEEVEKKKEEEVVEGKEKEVDEILMVFLLANDHQNGQRILSLLLFLSLPSLLLNKKCCRHRICFQRHFNEKKNEKN